ncbi:MAG: hypothetical protein JWQ74_1414 [Marmoricola sp.]|nr:hypothetical protein [Marmoricola sp.]
MIDGIPIGTYGPATLVAIAVILVFTGGLVPYRYYKALRVDRDKLQDTVDKQAEQISDILIPLGKNVASILRSLPNLASDTEDTR